MYLTFHTQSCNLRLCTATNFNMKYSNLPKTSGLCIIKYTAEYILVEFALYYLVCDYDTGIYIHCE
jgi:hypothetical protein